DHRARQGRDLPNMNPMRQTKSFGNLIARALGLIALLAVAANIVAIVALRQVVETKDRVVSVNAEMLIDIEVARVQRERRAKAVRSYVIAPGDNFIRQMGEARDGL